MRIGLKELHLSEGALYNFIDNVALYITLERPE